MIDVVDASNPVMGVIILADLFQKRSPGIYLALRAKVGIDVSTIPFVITVQSHLNAAARTEIHARGKVLDSIKIDHHT